MRVRAFLNRHPAATAAVVLVLTGVAVASVVYQLRPQSETPALPPKDFYTADDGESWFTDEMDKITPFDHGGKPAVQVHLFTCDGGKTQFVGYLEKLPDGALDTFRTRTHFPANAVPEADDVAEIVGSLVKRKGETEWVPSTDPARFQQVTQVHCPDGDGKPARVWAR
jgi:hypothetical protein